MFCDCGSGLEELVNASRLEMTYLDNVVGWARTLQKGSCAVENKAYEKCSYSQYTISINNESSHCRMFSGHTGALRWWFWARNIGQNFVIRDVVSG